MDSVLINCTGSRAGLCPFPKIVRGSLVHEVGAVAFIEFRRAVCAWSALHAHQVEALGQRQAL